MFLDALFSVDFCLSNKFHRFWVTGIIFGRTHKDDVPILTPKLTGEKSYKIYIISKRCGVFKSSIWLNIYNDNVQRSHLEQEPLITFELVI